MRTYFVGGGEIWGVHLVIAVNATYLRSINKRDHLYVHHFWGYSSYLLLAEWVWVMSWSRQKALKSLERAKTCAKSRRIQGKLLITQLGKGCQNSWPNISSTASHNNKRIVAPSLTCWLVPTSKIQLSSLLSIVYPLHLQWPLFNLLLSDPIKQQ